MFKGSLQSDRKLTSRPSPLQKCCFIYMALYLYMQFIDVLTFLPEGMLLLVLMDIIFDHLLCPRCFLSVLHIHYNAIVSFESTQS